jgi:hypothetical protein
MAHEPSPKVSIILLNLNSHADTRECLESLRELDYPNCEVIVFDNGSSDDSAARLQREFPEARFLRSEENLGFTGGNNIGIEEALRRGAHYVLLLNNDTIVDPGFVTHLVRVGESDDRIGVLGPKVFYAAEPDRIWYAGGYIKYGVGVCRHRGLDEVDRPGVFARVEDTEFVTGCAMMIKAQVLRELGGLDPRLFVYWEDTDFCMRARDANYRCVFVPMGKVWHKISRTCGSDSPFTLYLTTRNHLAWVAKHVPFPYKPGALALTLGRKAFKVPLLALKNRGSAAAVSAGIWAFLFGRYGAPRQARRPEAVVPV